MGSPRPSYGRARNYGTQGRNEYGRLGGLGIGPKYVNSYMEAGDPNLNHMYTSINVITSTLTLTKLSQQQNIFEFDHSNPNPKP